MGAWVLAAAFVLLGPLLPWDTGEVRFYWAAQIATGPENSVRYAVLDRDVVVLKSGDRLQFFLSPVTPIFAYLIHSDPAGVLQLLHPPSSQAALPLASGVPRYFPSRTGWYELEQARGIERVYVLVSATRLESLERAVQNHASAPGPRKAATAAVIIDMIGQLRKTHGQLERPAPRPATIAGSLRASIPDLAGVATEESAPLFYSRTYIIDHR